MDNTIYSVFDNTTKSEENVLISYNNIINNNGLDFIKNILFNDDKLSKTKEIEYLKTKSTAMLTKMVLERKIYNVIDWIFNDNKEIKNKLKNNIGNNWDMTYKGELTSFAKNLDNLFLSKIAGTISIIINRYDKQSVNIIQSIFDPLNISKISIIETNDGKVTENILNNKKYTLIINDDIDILSKHSKLLTGKSVLIPYTGYNFEQQKNRLIPDEDILISKYRMEFLSIRDKYNLSFFHPYVMTEEMFMEG